MVVEVEVEVEVAVFFFLFYLYFIYTTFMCIFFSFYGKRNYDGVRFDENAFICVL